MLRVKEGHEHVPVQDLAPLRATALLTCLLALASPAAAADTISDVSASYNVDVGPMTMMVIRFGASFSDDAVRAQATIKSKGISAVFSEYSARAEGEGRLDGGAIQPALFKLSRERDDRKKRTTIQWGDGGTISMDPPAHKKPEVQARVEKRADRGRVGPDHGHPPDGHGRRQPVQFVAEGVRWP